MIRLDRVTKYFGKLAALQNLSLTWEGGECVALIGPNGSGKTTLMKTILGMVVPDEGEISFRGKPIGRAWQYRSQLGYMPQIGRYPENMSVGQVLQLMMDIRGVSQNQLDLDLYNAYKLPTMLDKRMGTLSGGTRQKVSACLAFMFRPQVLILDEPTAGLDPLSTEVLKEKIKEETAKERLIIISSHVLSDLDDLATHITYMQEGRPLLHRPLDELKQETGEQRLGKMISKILREEMPQR